MKKQTIILFTLMTLSNLIFGQNSEEELKHYKQFLPYMIKGLQESKNDSSIKKLDNRVVGIFNKPWEVKKINEKTIIETITAITANNSLNIEQDYRQKWNLNFTSAINKNNAIEDTSNIDYILSNTFVSVSEIKLFDENNNSAIEKEERKIKINQSTDLEFYNSVINIDIPLKKEYRNLNGSIKLTLKQFETIEYKELKNTDENILFNLGNIEGIKLLKIEKNKAYFYLPRSIENIKIVSTNKEDKKYGENTLMPIPKSVYDFGMKDHLNEDLIKPFIEKVTLHDINEKPQILIYETNGNIENLYIYLKLSPVDLTSRTIEIKL
ncbi:hypothetical protein [Flavobacterium degerlachei]|nr:hypothetical protein [Flavobacterium degerlachei]